MNSLENKNENKPRYKNKYKYKNKKNQNENSKTFKFNNLDGLKKSRKNYKNNFCKTKADSKKYSTYKKKIKDIEKVNEKSCGCIIINNGRVLLVQQKKGSWGFPKGHVEFNETEIQTAIREVKEETNLDVKIYKKRRYTEKYFTYKGRTKQVVYFVAKQTGGFEKKQDSEIKSMKWLNFEDAFQKITYPNTKKIFGKVLMDLK